MDKIGIIGGGNMAWHLARIFSTLGHLEAIFVRSAEKKSDFGFLPQQAFVRDLSDLIKRCDMLFLALPDHQIAKILQSLNWENRFLVHVAGSVDMEIFQGKSAHYGVFYPLQSLSKFRDLDYRQIPFFIEANTPKNEHILFNLAAEISNKVMLLNSEKRRQIHLAAVFVNNFANHMWSIGQELCCEQKIPFHYLDALIQETYLKALENTPVKSQTGPAVRNDDSTINMHLDMLKNKALLKKIYSFVSQSIIQTKNR